MLYSNEYQIMKYFSVMLCQNIVPQKNKITKICKKFNDFVYFSFPLINSLKTLLHFLHFKLMITLLVYSMSINVFFESLVNDKFSNLKLNVFLITGFICSNKYVKQVVLINHSWSSPRHKGDWDWRPVYSPESGGGYIFPKRERLVK